MTERIELPYGAATMSADLRGCRLLDTIDIAEASAVADPPQAVREALAHPIGTSQTVSQLVLPNETVVIVVSDSFRQTRADIVVPVLLDELVCGGVNEHEISVLFSTGTHRGPSKAEQRAILGEDAHQRLDGRIYVHDAHDVDAHVNIGVTTRGTPVEINRRLHEADRVIATGGVVLHYFAGFGGGRKSIVPGLASAKTIAHNHAMNLHATEDTLDPAVSIGAMKGNPVAEDMLEATRLTRVDCIVNTVLNKHGEIAGVFAGDLEAAHAAACEFARDLFEVPIDAQADLVIAASPGTANFVQTHKALFNAWQAMKPGGRIVLLAPCPEGLGGEQFAKWLRLGDRASIIAALRKQSEINGQTALSTREKAPSMLMVTELDVPDVDLLGARKTESLQEAIDTALDELRRSGIESPTAYLMPSATYSVPVLTRP